MYKYTLTKKLKSNYKNNYYKLKYNQKNVSIMLFNYN